MNTLPRYTYQLLFANRDGNPEVFEHTTETDARAHFASFGIEDADIYSAITLIEVDWDTGLTHTLDTMQFPA